MYLQTPRMILRDFVPEDIDDLQEIFGDAEVMRFVEPPYSREKTHAFLQSFCIDRTPKGAYGAVERESGKLIGYLLFKPLDDPEIYEIGWIFNKAYWRKGYAFEICSELIRYAFTEMKLHKICAEAIDEVISVSLMQKLGMKPEGIQRKQTKDLQGVWRDLYWYAILREEYCGEA